MTDSDEVERWKRKRRNREKTVREIVSSEKTYIQALRYIIDEYKTPLRLGKPRLIPDEQIDQLFPRVLQTILTLNLKLCGDFEEKVLKDFDNEITPIAYLFKEFVPFFKMYTTYVNNHENASTELRHLRDDEKFTKYCKEKASICNGLDISSLLIQPIQRIPRYELLIRDLLSNTHDEHPDRTELESCFDELKMMNSRINKSMDEHKRRDAVRIVEEQLGGSAAIGFTLVGPARRLVKKGKFFKMSRQKNIEYTFFLFSDMLLYCSDRGNGSYKLHKKLPVNDAFSIQDVSESECPHGFILYNSVKSFKAFAPNADAKQTWFTALEGVVRDYRVRRPQLPSRPGEKELVAAIWDADGNRCVLCDKKFSLLTRRHHCRRCGRLVCHDCSKWRLPSLTKKTTVYERACRLCFQEYKDNGEETNQKHKVADGDGAESVMMGSGVGSSEPMLDETVPADLSSCERCRAIYDYDAEYGGDLSFKEGDYILVIEKKGDWWKGMQEDKSKNQKPGLFPSNYVEIIQGPKSGDIFVAICNYTAESDEELTLRQGERYVLNVIDGSGWWLVSSEENPQERGWTSPQLVQNASEYQEPEEVIKPSMNAFTSNVSEINEPKPSPVAIDPRLPMMASPVMASPMPIDPRLQSLAKQATQKRQSGLPRPSVKNKTAKPVAAPPPHPKIEKMNSGPLKKKFQLGAKKNPTPATPPGPPPPPKPATKVSEKAKSKPKPAVVAPLEDMTEPEVDSGNTFHTYAEMLKMDFSNLPSGMDRHNLESYLCDEEFGEVFDMTREKYARMAKWKKTKLKQKAKLW